MAHLSTMDATFLYNETPETPMHVAGLAIFKPNENYDGNVFEDYRKFIADRVHLISYLHRRLGRSSFVPFDPIWVEDYDLDWDYHIRHNALPKPGTRKQLTELVERLHAVPLDRNRPLWQFCVIEGLEDGGFALYTKTHHACLDGGAGMITMDVLYDKTPDPSEVEPPRVSGHVKAQQPEWLQQLTESYTQMMRQQIEMVQNAPQFLKSLEAMGRKAVNNLTHPETIRRVTPPKTLINNSIGRDRSFSTLTLPLGEVKALGKAAGVKINDLVMVLCGGALRNYLLQQGDLPDDPLIAGVPVSLRKPGYYAVNNQVTMMLASLGTDIADPLERLAEVAASMVDAKENLDMVKDNIHMEYSFYGAPLYMQALTKFMSETRLADSLPPTMNAVVSNVPGSRIPLYLLGHQMEAYFPVSIPNHGVGLNMTVQSYLDNLDFGFVSAKTSIPDAKVITDLIAVEFEALKASMARAEAVAKAEAAGTAPKAKEQLSATQKTAARAKPTAKPGPKPAKVTPAKPQRGDRRREMSAPKLPNPEPISATQMGGTLPYRPFHLFRVEC